VPGATGEILLRGAEVIDIIGKPDTGTPNLHPTRKVVRRRFVLT
jgi:hypothetical protein